MRPVFVDHQMIKVGDIVQDFSYEHSRVHGVVVGFVEHAHPKEAQKVIVISNGELVKWIAQYCRVVSDNRANEP